MHCYSNPSCGSIADFEEDWRRPSQIKRLLGRWNKDKNDINVRLTIAHIITFYNVFEPDFATHQLFKRVGSQNRTGLNTFLVALERSYDFVDIDRDLYYQIKKDMGL